ncbi:hypothetical protein Tco_0230429, partial [Tanacetum coccineum]
AKFYMASHASSALNSLRSPSAAMSRSIQVFETSPRIIKRFILMLLEHQDVILEYEGCVSGWVLRGCGGWSFIHHDDEQKSNLPKGHKEKIDYKKAN